MQMSTEILYAMMRGANPLFLIGLIAEHERYPLAVQTALREASNTYYQQLEQKYEHDQILRRMRKKGNDKLNKRLLERAP